MDDPAAEVPVVDPTADAAVFLQIGKKWDALGTGGAYTEVKTCKIPSDATVGTQINCDLSIPEAELFYSNLNFKWGTTTPTACPLLVFQPFWYTRQTTDATLFGDTESTSCQTGNPTPAKCFGGAGPVMIDEFPKNTALITETLVGPSSSKELKSEYQNRWYFGRRVNYLVTNDYATPGTPIAAGQINSMTGDWTDWSVYCLDYWGELQYQINMVISDENTENTVGGPQDSYTDWP